LFIFQFIAKHTINTKNNNILKDMGLNEM